MNITTKKRNIMARLNQQRGFTILELMITVTVAGVLSMMAFPSFVTMTKITGLQPRPMILFWP